MNEIKYYAHSFEGEPQSNWQLLKDHLVYTAVLTEIFASKFESANIIEIVQSFIVYFINFKIQIKKYYNEYLVFTFQNSLQSNL